MNQQVFVIHGGDAFAQYEDYLTHLKNKEVNPEDINKKDWKSTLGEKLGENYGVLAPRMPNSQNAKYREWKIIFEKYLPFLADGVIFIGHSLGGIFLAKYLAEETISKKISGTFLVSAPFNQDGSALADFILPSDLTKFNQQGGKIFLYHSEDDPVVPFSDSKKYHDSLPQAHVRTFPDRQHFNQADLPEIIQDISSCLY